MSILGLGFQKKMSDFFAGKTKPVVFPYGKNLFNKDDLVEGKYLNQSGVETISSGWFCTDYIWVVGGLKLIFSHSVGGSSLASIVIYNKDKSVIKSITQVDFAADNRLLLLPANAEYIRISLNINKDVLQVEYGTTSTAYENFDPTPTQPSFREPQKVISEKLEKYVEKNTLPFVFPYGKNLFNKDTTVKNTSINSVGAQVTSSGWETSDFIFIISYTNIKFSSLSGTSSAGCAFYDANKNFISWVSNNDIIDSGYIIVTPDGSAYMRCSFLSSSNLDSLQIEYGEKTTAYEKYSGMPSIPNNYGKQTVLIDSIKESIFSLKDYHPIMKHQGKNLFNKLRIGGTDSYINSAGKVSSYSLGWYYSEFIPVIQNASLVFSGNEANWSQNGGCAFYDKDKNFISWISCFDLEKNGNAFRTPNGCYYLRFSNQNGPFNNINTMQLEYGTSSTNYEVYTEYPFEISKIPFEKVVETNKLDIYQIPQKTSDVINSFYACFNDIIAIATNTRVNMQLNGFNSKVYSIALSDLPNLIAGSVIIRIFILPFTRNATTSYSGKEWRLNIVTNKGQVYHNFPSRNINSDGTAQENDFMLFDEGCIWELPERWAPVKTTEGDDATLIATGKYKYYPALPDSEYTFYPAISSDNGYGNGGFPSVLEKTNQANQTVKFARFRQPNRGSSDYVSLDFMGGLFINEKICAIGTYRNNSTNKGCRIGVFYTNDGGRNWFLRYEFGTGGRIIGHDDVSVWSPESNYQTVNLFVDLPAISTGEFNVIARHQYAPDAADKEPVDKFKYIAPVAISSITPADGKITVVTSAAHGLSNGDIVLFEKQAGAVRNDWDWIVNTGHTANSAGDGVLFKVVVVNSTTFYLRESIHNPHNNLACRHIHSINKSRHGILIGCGERYPQGWIMLHNYVASDSFAQLRPWDDFTYVRLNSTPLSAERPLGTLIDKDDNFIIGMDNESTNIGTIELPTGRTATITKASTGVYKMKMSDIDNLASAECLVQSSEVAYFFQEINGVMIFIGQLGHLAVSFDGGDSWLETKLDIPAPLERFSGVMSDRMFMIQNHIFHLKG